MIRQNNNLDYTGAWAPSALVEGTTVSLWYHTGALDLKTDSSTATRVLRSRLDSNGNLETTKACHRTDTNGDLSATNVSVTQLANGTYWLVGNDFSSPGVYDLVAYTSKDGTNWTPWSGTDPYSFTLMAPCC